MYNTRFICASGTNTEQKSYLEQLQKLQAA